MPSRVKARNAWNWASIRFNHDEHVGVNRAAYRPLPSTPLSQSARRPMRDFERTVHTTSNVGDRARPNRLNCRSSTGHVQTVIMCGVSSRRTSATSPEARGSPGGHGERSVRPRTGGRGSPARVEGTVVAASPSFDISSGQIRSIGIL